MKKVLSLLSVVFLSSVGSSRDSDFEYKYIIVADSNDVSDLMYMYNIKEKTIDMFEGLIFNVNESYHKETIIDNLDNFSGKDYEAYYKNDSIYIVIGDGNGKSISGDLRKNVCDSKPIRVQFFFSEFFN